MNITEINKILSHLQSICKTSGLHYSLLIFDDEDLEVKIWRKDKNTSITIMDKAINLCDCEAPQMLLLSINEAIAKNKIACFNSL